VFECVGGEPGGERSRFEGQPLSLCYVDPSYPQHHSAQCNPSSLNDTSTQPAYRPAAPAAARCARGRAVRAAAVQRTRPPVAAALRLQPGRCLRTTTHLCTLSLMLSLQSIPRWQPLRGCRVLPDQVAFPMISSKVAWFLSSVRCLLLIVLKHRMKVVLQQRHFCYGSLQRCCACCARCAPRRSLFKATLP